MAYLARNEGIHQGALAEILEVEPITLVRILDKLEERGLVERRRHPTDRRIRLLFLTDAAREPLMKMLELGNLTRADALFGVTETEGEHLVQLLAQMKINLVEACNSPSEELAVQHG
jgi:DNA-binding MarR family transcriptional regulator